MSLTNSQRRALRAQANNLKSMAFIGKAGVTEAVVEQIRGLFERTELLKIRVQTEESSEVDGVGERLAGRVPCEIVARTGFVLLCYRARPGESERDRQDLQD